MWPDDSDNTVSHETIYNAIYLHPRGELKRELIACLRHHNQVRKPRSRGADRRGQIKDMQSIHMRPPEIEGLSIYSQEELDAIALSLNTRPRETLGWKTPLAVYTEHMARLQLLADSIH